MTTPLKIRHPGQPSVTEHILFWIFIVGPLAMLWFCWRRNLDIHLENSWLNLAAHAGILAIPMVWVVMMKSVPMSFEPTEEIRLGKSGYFEKLPANWWMMALLWPAPLFALAVIARDSFTEYLPHPEALSTSPVQALITMVVTFCLAFFYATLFQERFETRVSEAGVRTGLIRVYEWPNIHHFCRRGDLFSVYHRINPALPAASFKVRDPNLQAILERFIADHNIQVVTTPASLGWVKPAVLAGCAANLAFLAWLRFNTSLALIWLVLISFAIGILLTLALERKRGVSKISKYMPVLEITAEGIPARDKPEIMGS